MQNFIKSGQQMTVTAPANVNSGDLVVVGAMFGVAGYTAAAGASLEITCGGMYELPKADAQAWTQGQKVYWDTANKVVTNVSGANLYIGVAALPYANTAGLVVGRVRLNPSF